jgi:hypothetical protein
MKLMSSVLCFAAFDITDQALTDEKQLLSVVEAILADDERTTAATGQDDVDASLPA